MNICKTTSIFIGSNTVFRHWFYFVGLLINNCFCCHVRQQKDVFEFESLPVKNRKHYFLPHGKYS